MLSSLSLLLAQSAEEQLKELQDKVALDSSILAEQFYFWTVVVMWLIHAGFMAYEAGAARRKNLMSTAMKNILTIAVVTPTFYYFGWYIYGCFEEGWPKSGHASPDAFPGFCGADGALERRDGAEPADHVSLVFFLAFLLFSWTTGSIMSGALIERVRLSAYLILTAILGSVRLDHGRRLGLELRRLARRRGSASTTRSRRSSSTASPARSRSACCSTSGRASASTTYAGAPEASEATTRT